MNGVFNVAVLGPIPLDEITTWQGEEVEKYGCSLYTAASLSSLLAPGSRVVPIAHVRKIDHAAISGLLGDLAHVETSYVSSSRDRGDVITLHYTDQNQRIERQTSFMPPISPADLNGLEHFDAFVCVPITDFEVPLLTLQHIRNSGDGLIVFDAHGPTNTCTRQGERALKFWIERDLWLPYIDILKMNRDEAACCWFAKDYELSELQQIGELPMDQLPKLALHCLDQGVKAVYVTLDEHGCAVYFKSPNGKLREHVVKRVPVDEVVDTTGCGDSFAGGLAYGYLKTRDFVLACEYGNAMGSQRCTSTELNVYLGLEETERQIDETYRI